MGFGMDTSAIAHERAIKQAKRQAKAFRDLQEAYVTVLDLLKLQSKRVHLLEKQMLLVAEAGKKPVILPTLEDLEESMDIPVENADRDAVVGSDDTEQGIIPMHDFEANTEVSVNKDSASAE